ncbi:hypothetical protein KHS38_14345 [Mucilaginibacter sp. Bleaf8]|uniref:AbiTii domain-containing protein n=1 Tax=Mucilaginibacter sp. Bleaf8 TaxID=2834430 RepID=UPI001BD04C46|nr:hypothetical protein [Mucilaginibacter sp. Bleaf8]MBS7565589.1 hypothetical protein [Mucilaginibacter sp. Bleaf8]
MMQLLETIINELTDTNLSLTSPLLKTKLLASRIKNEELLYWVNNELNGYTKKEDLPEYRTTTGNLIGDYINGNMHISNHILPIPSFDDDFDNQLRRFDFFEGVEPLEKLSDSAKDLLVQPFNNGQVKIIQKLLYKHSNHAGNFSLLSAGISVTSSVLKTTLNAIRNKLLDFMISLESEFGVELNIETLQSNTKKVTHIMHTTINNTGDGNVINTGSNVSIDNNIHIKKDNKDTLKETLKENKVSDDDLSDLMQIIDTERPTSDTNFGENVNRWIHNMMGKALDGTWKVGLSAAGGILAKAISHYYGIGEIR